jgi:NAD(P)-dependent dehydrogenase (short-subunit alcohol dehydrogenase family)
MNLGIDGRVAIVTGGARGMGATLCELLATEGAHAAVVDTDEDEAAAVVEKIKSSGGSASAHECDVTDYEGCREAAEQARQYGATSILVNMASIRQSPVTRFMDSSLEGPTGWRRMVEVCLIGTFNMTHVAAPDMIDQRWGRIIHFSSDGARTGEPHQAHHYAAKSGMFGFSMSIARELGRHNITSNVICPSLTLVPRNTDRLSEEQLEKILRAYPMRKLGAPEDAPNVALFLASELAGHITGQTISVNGGFFMSA